MILTIRGHLFKFGGGRHWTQVSRGVAGVLEAKHDGFRALTRSIT